MKPTLFALAFASSLCAQNARIMVDTSRVENHVSPMMYGAFSEIMAEGVQRGITAEMLHDRSFEEAPNHLGLPASWRIEPDERNDNAGALKFEQTTQEAYPQTNKATGLPGHSLRVRLTNGDVLDERCGLSQGGISIVGDVTYAGYVWVKVADQRGYKGQITVALEEDETDGETYDRAALPVTGQGGWHQYSFRLSPTKTNRLAKFTILFEGAGTLYLDQVSLMPANTTNNIRDDSAQMIASLGPSFIRWPGGNVAQDYHWQWGIGPRDLRPIWTNRAWSDAPEPNDLGTDEYLALCARVHAQPSITVNVNGAGATPEEAAAWVEYVNGPSSSHYGALRAANGHPDPYSVRYWELGNEIYGDWVRGHTDAKIYAQNALEYAHAMRAVDPAIQLIVVGAGDNWNTPMLTTVGRKIDYLAIHDYTAMSQNAKGADTRAQMMERAGEFEANYRHIGELILSG
jgi:alpha-L-arabinofuranosidase